MTPCLAARAGPWVRALLPILVLAFGVRPAIPATGERWRLLYSYDQLHSQLVINDFKFLTSKYGVAVGFLIEDKGKFKPTTLTTADGGVHWVLAPAKEIGTSVFFVGENRGWMVAEKGIWQSRDAGRTWSKLSPLEDIERVYFVDAEHGFAAGEHKRVYETTDGGKEWKELPAAAQPESTAEFTTYNWLDFATPKTGIITGSNQPQSNSAIPEWMIPGRQRVRHEVPHLSIFLQTTDGGKTWDATTGSIFGRVTCVRLSPAGFGLGLIEFSDAFEWPSEVFRIDWTTGKSDRVFREKNRLITDVALPPTGPSYLAGIEKLDRLSDSPVPGKLIVVRSEDLDNWQEMDVDYRATAHRAMISALDDQNIWVATDTGMVLKLTGAK